MTRKHTAVLVAATKSLVSLKMVRLVGGYDDGYADNLSLVITQ